MKDYNHYPTYDVMEQNKEWDAHTRSIVSARLVREHAYGYLTFVEAETLRAWCSLLMDDHRGEIIQYVINHIDQVLSENKRERDNEKWAHHRFEYFYVKDSKRSMKRDGSQIVSLFFN